MKNDWKTKYLYVLAEIENLKKQQAKEKIKNVERAEEKILFELLEIIDNFKRADYCERFSEGIALIYQQFKNVLESYGVSSFVSLNKPFDPDFHEAVEQRDSNEASGTVIEVVQTGYLRKGKVLKYAKVVVAI